MVTALQTLFQSPRDPNFFQNPFTFYRKIRASGKIVRWDDYNLVVTSDYTIVNNILRNRQFVRQPPEHVKSEIPDHLIPFYENESRSMLEREPPYHTRVKSLVSPFFTSKKLAKMQIEIENICSDLLNEITETEFDLISSFSQKFPVIVIAKMLGVPATMAPQLVAWSSDMVAMYQARRNKLIEKKAASATNDFSNYLKTLIKQKRLHPSDDLITHIIEVNPSESRLSDEEIISTIILLLNAGHEATVHTISNGIKTLLESRFAITELMTNPKKLANEVLRYSTPLHMFTRYFTTKVSLCGRDFNAGDKIGLLLAAANRDPEHFSKPELFDPFIERKINLSLGAGLHFCLGAHLARLELEIALVKLITKFPTMKISSTPIYQDNFHFYGLKELVLKTTK